MTDKPESETPLHIRQAEGLRQLADLIEHDPGFARQVQFSLGHMYNYAISGDLRADLLSFRASALNAGAEVVIENRPTECEVRATFSAIEVTRSATASRMAGQQPSAVDYEPLVVED